MPTKNQAAVKLGRMARGKPKHLSEAERRRRAEAMKQNQTLRWKAKLAAVPRLTEGEV